MVQQLSENPQKRRKTRFRKERPLDFNTPPPSYKLPMLERPLLPTSAEKAFFEVVSDLLERRKKGLERASGSGESPNRRIQNRETGNLIRTTSWNRLNRTTYDSANWPKNAERRINII